MEIERLRGQEVTRPPPNGSRQGQGQVQIHVQKKADVACIYEGFYIGGTRPVRVLYTSSPATIYTQKANLSQLRQPPILSRHHRHRPRMHETHPPRS